MNNNCSVQLQEIDTGLIIVKKKCYVDASNINSNSIPYLKRTPATFMHAWSHLQDGSIALLIGP